VISIAGDHHPPANPDRRMPPADRYATGQLLALAVVLLVGLPLLPIITLLVFWMRLRDRILAHALRRATDPPQSPVQAAP
jgi:hypothetical protein